MRPGLLILLLVAPACWAANEGTEEAEPAPAGALPDVQSKGEIMGPQPGPDRALGERDNPYGMEPNVLAEGRRLFTWYNCAGCHGGHGGGGMGPSLRDVKWMYGFKDHDIYNSIAEGRPHGMPAWGTKLPREQIWKLTAYIMSMGTAKEPSPPPQNPVFPNPPPRRDVQKREAQKGGD